LVWLNGWILERKILDYRIGKQLLAHSANSSGGMCGALSVHINRDEPSNSHVRDRIETKRFERTNYSGALRIQDSGTRDYLNRDTI